MHFYDMQVQLKQNDEKISRCKMMSSCKMTRCWSSAISKHVYSKMTRCCKMEQQVELKDGEFAWLLSSIYVHLLSCQKYR
jgi:hypothetical protein